MEIAYAADPSGNTLAPFIPILILGVLVGIVLKIIAKRKGRSQWGWFFIGFIPFYGIVIGLWLASLPDKGLYDKISHLLDKIQNSKNQANNEDKLDTSSKPKSWKCKCGNINGIEIEDCPKCGENLKSLLEQSNML